MSTAYVGQPQQEPQMIQRQWQTMGRIYTCMTCMGCAQACPAQAVQPCQAQPPPPCQQRMAPPPQRPQRPAPVYQAPVVQNPVKVPLLPRQVS